MTKQEVKAAIFDILAEVEQLQVKANELINKKNELLKELEKAT